MKISVIGTGYVGLVTGTCFAEMGNDVICIDVNEEKINELKNGKIPIYEPGLVDLVQSNIKNNRLFFTTDIHLAMEKSDICFIAVGTPMGDDGSADLQYVCAVAKEIGMYMDHHMYIVDKSTVPVGTAQLVSKIIQSELKKRHSELTFDVISNPEFLKEGTACDDFLKPDRVIVGADSLQAIEIMQELYSPFILSDKMFITMDTKSAELTKYAANAMLATKISFINEISNICERVGADINKVRLGMGSDSRIGYSFIYPGCGYGGSCFPKDVKALISTGSALGYSAEILKAVENVNQQQKMVIAQKVINVLGENLQNKKIAVWGLSFKPGTDDMREAPSVTIIKILTNQGAQIKAYDPKAMEQAKHFYLQGNENVEYMDNKYDVLNGADALLLITEWKEFRSPDFIEIAKRMRSKVIFDGRNQYKAKTLDSLGFEYHQIGVGR